MTQKIKTILVTGGAGYIAAPSVLLLLQNNYQVVVVDKKPEKLFALRAFFGTEQLVYIQADYANTEMIKDVCTSHNVVACMHFAAYIEVGESVTDPRRYYENNVTKTITLINTLLAAGVKRFIFSSSCAVFGIPQELPLVETHTRNPISPYGNTKYIIELVLEDYARAYGLQYGILRYFNAAGGVPEYNLYERHEPETHLIPKLIMAALQGAPCTIFGNDYPTPDGTCVRDYVHIKDLAHAHYKTLTYLLTHTDSVACNLGTGTGYSVAEIIKTIETVTGKKLACAVMPRRAGDPEILVADPQKAFALLQWRPQFSTLSHIVETAYSGLSNEAKNKSETIHTKTSLHTRACSSKQLTS